MGEAEDVKPLEPIKALKNLGIGISVPFIFAIGFGIVGGVIAMANGSDKVVRAVKFGAGVGLFLSLYGGLEIAIGLLIEGGRMENRLWRAAGFLTVWAIAVYVFFNFDFK